MGHLLPYSSIADLHRRMHKVRDTEVLNVYSPEYVNLAPGDSFPLSIVDVDGVLANMHLDDSRQIPADLGCACISARCEDVHE
jgi:hypothetical protein